MTKTNKTEAEILARALRNRQLHSGQDGLLLVQDFLAFIGHPERSFQPFHIAGTSGKGSTAICLSKLLGAHGFKTGLMQSPHLTDIRERFMINNKFLEHNKTLGYFKEFTTKLDCFEKTDKRRLNYFQIMTTFAFFVFRKENTRFAVIEVGIGGLFDSTNALPKEGKIAIITRIGKDHTEILGKKLSEIAYQKAMIMGQSSICLSSPQSLSAKKVIIDVAKTQKSELYLSEKSITNIRRSDTAHLVDFKHESTFFNDLEITPKAPFQIENFTLALCSFLAAAKKFDFPINEKVIRNTLSSLTIPGRMEIFKNAQSEIIIDAAHNPQKFKALVEALKTAYPNKKFIFIVSFKKGKDYEGMLSLIIPLAKKIIATDYNHKGLTGPRTESPDTFTKCLINMKYKDYKIISDPTKTLAHVRNDNHPIVICGSFYLLNQLIPEIKKL